MINYKTFDSPKDFDASGWKKILMRVKERIEEDNITIVSAGVAFYAFLAIFPALMAIISIYGLVVSPQQVEQQISNLSGMMPEDAFSIIKERIENLVSTSGSTLSWSLALGILISLWSANTGIKSLFTGLDIAYDTKNNRGFIKQNAISLAFTFGAIITLILSLGLIVVFPAIVETFGLPGNIESIVSWLRWPLLAIIVIGVISLFYRFAPDRKTPEFKWVVVGAALATLLWLLASLGFSYYVSNFGNYGEMYGAISAVVIMLLWLFITCFIILLGGEVNSASENYAKHRLDNPE